MLQKIVYAEHEYHIDLVSDGGVMRYLLYWAKHNNYRFQLTPKGVALVFHPGLPMRPIVKKIYPSDPIVAKLVDRLDQLLQHQAVSVGGTEQSGAAQKTKLTINLESISPDLLILVSRQLNRLPVELTSVTLHLHSGLMSGSIQLSSMGAIKMQMDTKKKTLLVITIIAFGYLGYQIYGLDKRGC